MKRCRRGVPDQGADSVVGFILITAIALAAIAIVVLSGGPALERVQSQQENDAMIRYMSDLDQGISSLVSGAPAGATPVWRVSMARGSLFVDDTGHTWAYSVNLTEGKGLWYAHFSDGDEQFDIEHRGSVDNIDLRVGASLWHGSTQTEENDNIQTDADFDAGDGLVVTLPWQIGGNTTEVRFFDDSTSKDGPFARVWIVDARAVAWELPAGGEVQQVYWDNTAIVADVASGQVLHNDPRIRGPQDDTGNSKNIFVRIVKINGNLSLGGRSSAEVLLSSEGNQARYSSSDVGRVQIYPSTKTQQTWITGADDDCTNGGGLLDDDARGYTYEVRCNQIDPSAEPVAWFEKPTGATLSTSFVETPVTLRGGGLS